MTLNQAAKYPNVVLPKETDIALFEALRTLKRRVLEKAAEYRSQCSSSDGVIAITMEDLVESARATCPALVAELEGASTIPETRRDVRRAS